ncbi:MAG: glycosyltransferase N-terminal domain-containing protein [Bacteroidota bacterium]
MQLISPFHSKAKKGIEGRKTEREDWAHFQAIQKPIVWFHCASLGEYEQGKPLMQKIKEERPDTFLLVSFYSPSGHEHVKGSKLPDSVIYLPLDSKANMRALLTRLSPSLVILVKYELWLNWLNELFIRQVPVVLISARIESGGSFLQSPFRKLYVHALGRMKHIFTQTHQSAMDLKGLLPENIVTESSDTRFDRVLSSRQTASPIQEIATLCEGRFVWICGSTYEEEEKMILQAYQKMKASHDPLLIFAPHEIDKGRMAKWVSELGGNAQIYSTFKPEQKTDILWIDHIGWLSRLYQYGNIALIGGAWGKGLHNILEAVTFGCPVVFGPKYENFPEAVDLIQLGGAFAYSNQEELEFYLSTLEQDDALREKIAQINTAYIDEKAGATQQIFDFLLNERLLP